MSLLRMYKTYQPPLGAPPRAGFVGSNGEVVVWRDAAPVVLARWPEPVYRAIETRYGIVLLGSGEAVLVRPDGRVESLGTNLDLAAATDADGCRLAVVESHYGRRSWNRLHVIDLADGARRTMPWDERRTGLAVVAVRRNTVYFRHGGAGTGSMRWRPGADPQPLPYLLRQLDAVSGIGLATDAKPGVLLVYGERAVRRLVIDPLATLAPGGTRLFTYRIEPPAISVFGPRGTSDRPRVYHLPRYSQVGMTGPERPVWENPDRLTILVEHGEHDLGAPAVRLDLRTGRFEGVPLAAEAGNRPLLVEPCARPAGPVSAGGQPRPAPAQRRTRPGRAG